jgi:NAD(P)-dependent dehydrogenase (short-subunit alcohol dehydrogenase family)
MIDDAEGTLSGKDVVIVGSSGQMGRAIARAAARQGARIVLLGRTRERPTIQATTSYALELLAHARESIAKKPLAEAESRLPPPTQHSNARSR